MNKFSISLLLLTICSACGQPTTPEYNLLPTAEIRYQEANQELRAIVRLRQGDSLSVSSFYTAPDAGVLFMGSPMQLRKNNSEVGDRWVESRNLRWPAELLYSVPSPDFKTGDERTTISVSMAPPTARHLPAVIELAKGSRFQFGDEPLKENENLLLFLETDEWNPGVKRILLAGPSATNFMNLPASSIAGLPGGNYQAYLVKQQLSRDSLPGLAASTQLEYFTISKAVEVR